MCVSVCLGDFLCMYGSVVLNLLATFFLIVFDRIYVYTYLCVCVCVCVCVCFQLDVFVRDHIWHKV